MTLIRATNVTKRFGTTTAVDDISMTVDPGEVVGLLGANGAGKTTLMRMILGLLPTSEGTIEVIEQLGLSSHESIGYVPQGLGLYPELTVLENLGFIAAAFGVETPKLEPPLSDVADRQVGAISLGLRRRTAFAAAQCHDPKLFILDEPTSGVGPLGRAELWDMIHQAADDGSGVLVSTHYMEEAEECDRVIVMAQGKQVAEGPVTSIVGSLEVTTIAGGSSQDLEVLRASGMTLLASGDDWRVLDGDLGSVESLVSDSAQVSSVPATFEEAFVKLST